MSGRIAVGVSGAGTSLQALVAASRRGAVGGDVILVFADRECPALGWAAEQGIDTALVPVGPAADAEGRAAADEALAATLRAVAPDLVVLAGYMRVLGPATLAACAGRIVNLHAALLPAFPGAHPVRDALAAGVRVSGTTIHLVDATLDGGPILAQQAVAVMPGDDEHSLHERDQGGRAPAPAARRRGAPGQCPAAAPRRPPAPSPGAPVRLGQDRSSKPRSARPAWSSSASSLSPPAARAVPCATPACPSPTSRRSPASRRCSTAASRRFIR